MADPYLRGFEFGELRNEIVDQSKEGRRSFGVSRIGSICPSLSGGCSVRGLRNWFVQLNARAAFIRM